MTEVTYLLNELVAQAAYSDRCPAYESEITRYRMARIVTRLTALMAPGRRLTIPGDIEALRVELELGPKTPPPLTSKGAIVNHGAVLLWGTDAAAGQ